MTQQKFCQDCSQKHNCQEVYRQLGNSKGSSVVFKTVVAFLLPLLVFIAVLAASEKILAKAINSKEVQTVLSFLLALTVASAVVLVTKAMNKKLGKDK